MEGWKRIRWVLLYGIFYLMAFYAIEQRSGKINIIHTKMDDMIPFCEYFIAPYVLWFFFVAATIFYFAFINESRQEFYRLIWNLGIGMTIFIVVSWLYPNGHNLRPALTGKNIFELAVMCLYRIDTSTNIFPSIHVFNSIACCIAFRKNERCRNHKIFSIFILLLTITICLSTVFLKQHSVVDVAGAILMALGLYLLVYPNKHLFAFGRGRCYNGFNKVNAK